MTEYSQRFEQYNKTIYVSELMSLVNLQADYNYNPVKVTVDAAGRVYVIASGINHR